MNLIFNPGMPPFPNVPFIPLGAAAQTTDLQNDNSLLSKKISKTISYDIDNTWGTLGWADDKPFTPAGELYFSERGNNDEGINQNGEPHRLTQQEISDLKEINPQLDPNSKGQVWERYINFNDIHFDLPEVFDPRELPKLRLTLFLQPNQGAIVYYQHSELGNKSDEDAVFEYILHQGGETDRDRLTYVFPVEPKNKLVAVDEANHLYKQSDEPTGTAFIIKILTFKQAQAPDQEIFDSQVSELNRSTSMKMAKKLSSAVAPGTVLYELVGKDKYDLLLFDKTKSQVNPGGVFVSVTTGNQLNLNAKTLLLIHGTFVNTNASFKDLLLFNSDKNSSYLQHLLESGKFEQIIALNHPTISHDAAQNVEWLKGKLSELNIQFTQPLQIITTSRGALVAEFMASDPEVRQYIPEIRKVMMFSAGNGCGYFQIGGKISAVLSFWKKTASGPAGKVILAIAQLSVDWFLSQPGCVLMNEDKPVLGSILNKAPLNPNIQYKTVASDWHNCLSQDLKWYKRWKNTSLDTLIKIALGSKHDWVIGFERQIIVPKNSNTPQLEERHSVHGRYLERGYVKHSVNGNCQVMADPHVVIADFFD